MIYTLVIQIETPDDEPRALDAGELLEKFEELVARNTLPVH